MARDCATLARRHVTRECPKRLRQGSVRRVRRWYTAAFRRDRDAVLHVAFEVGGACCPTRRGRSCEAGTRPAKTLGGREQRTGQDSIHGAELGRGTRLMPASV